MKIKSTEKLETTDKMKKKSLSEKKYNPGLMDDLDRNPFVGFNNSEDLGSLMRNGENLESFQKDYNSNPWRGIYRIYLSISSMYL